MPWKKIATSAPVWAVNVANFCMDWGGYTLMTNIPTFYKEVLKFDIESVIVVFHEFWTFCLVHFSHILYSR
jgi:hypothetical protein